MSWGDRDIEVTATFEYEGGLDGIGPWECHGATGFDKGEWRVEGVWFKDFTTDEELSAEEKLKVEIFCENYAESGNVEESIYNSPID